MPDGRFGSIFIHANAFGPLMALGLVLAIFHNSRVRMMLIAEVSLYCYLLFMCQSATSLVTAFLCLTAYIVSYHLLKLQKIRVSLIRALVLLLILSPIVVFGSAVYVWPAVLDILGRDLTLTGRVPFWSFLLQYDKGMQARLLGFGFNGFFNPQSSQSLSAAAVASYGFAKPFSGQAHNGFIRTYMELGWVGLTLLVPALSLTYFRIIRTLFTNPGPRIAMIHSLWWFTILINLTEDRFLNSTIWFLLLIFVSYFSNEPQFADTARKTNVCSNSH